MTTKTNYTTLIPYFLCTTLYLFAAIINSEILEKILVSTAASASILDKTYHYGVLGYIAASILLFIFSSYINLHKITIFTLVIYVISIFNIGFFEFSGTAQKIYPMIYSGTSLVITTILLCYIFGNEDIKKVYSLWFFIISYSVAYFLSQVILSYKSFETISIDLTSIRTLVIINIASVVIFLFVFISTPHFRNFKNNPANIYVILRNIDLELISSFGIFYIMMIVFYDYTVYQFTDTLLTIMTSEIKYYVLITMLCITLIAQKLVFKYNYHKVNILSLVTSLSIFLSLPFWSKNLILSSACWLLVAVSLYFYLFSNILILSEKFTQSYLRIAIVLYSMAGSIGYYAGYILMENIENDDYNESNLLLSICFVLVGLISYYLYSYKKNNLGKW